MTPIPTATLPDGWQMPVFGLGTWQLTEPSHIDLIAKAAELGYRLFDTAEEYGSEPNVRDGLKISGIEREAFFITTKVYFDQLNDGALQTHARQSLERLDCGWLDLLLVHWPNPNVPLDETIGALNSVVDDGIARSIGVSNFPPGLLKQAIALSRYPLATNQVEYHPALDQSALLSVLRSHGMVLTAHTPLGIGALLNDPALNRIAARHGVSAAQVILRWHTLQDRVVVIPRTSKPARLAENLAALNLNLDDADLAKIDQLKRPDGRFVDPPFAPDWSA